MTDPKPSAAAEVETALDHLERLEIQLARIRNAIAALKATLHRLADKVPRD